MAQSSDPIELYEAAVQGFRQTLSGVKPDQMQGSTPCTEWTVQNLIVHNLKVFGFAEGVLQENITVNSMEVGGAIPGGDSVKALDDGVAKVLEILKAAGSADTGISTPFGDMTRGQFMINPTWDLLVHRWDLAKATGQNTELDQGLVEYVYNMLSPMADGMREMEFGGQHIVGARVAVPDSASLQDKLLGAFGRQP
ncbi:MAG: TIGR03086 family protein [Chloroflexi bacterium]|nr:TIGR03086 family protein [Chloroflexota bacterium]